MQCPFCKSEESKVLESRSADDSRSVRRRRECLSCERRFTTYERVEIAPTIIIKNSGSREVYSREKLFNSILRSCSKAQISGSMIDNTVDKVEGRIYQDFPKELESSKLGEMVLEELRNVDKIAYLRYASIFKKFNSVDEFVEELAGVAKGSLIESFNQQEKPSLVV